MAAFVFPFGHAMPHFFVSFTLATLFGVAFNSVCFVVVFIILFLCFVFLASAVSFLASVVVVEFAISVALMRIILLEAVAEYETMGPPPPKTPTFYITSPYSTVSVGKSRMSEVKPKTGGHRDVCAM